MNGYFLRLAASVLHPGGSIHPVLRPVFGAPSETASGFDEEKMAAAAPPETPVTRSEPNTVFPLIRNETNSVSPYNQPLEARPLPEVAGEPELEPRRPAAADAPSPTRTPLAASAPPQVQADGAAAPVPEAPVPEQKHPFRPSVIPRLQDEADGRIAPGSDAAHWLKPVEKTGNPESYNRQEIVTPPPERPIATAGRASSTPPPPVEKTACAEADTQGYEQRSSRSIEDKAPSADSAAASASDSAAPAVIVRERFMPLVAKDAGDGGEVTPLAGSPKPAIMQTLKPAIAGRGNLARGEGAGRQTAPPREPDEIQIHIGRIEVTAAPPPPARPPAARPTQKAPTLNDYLQQRHGRMR
jgi:hypothetical protein